MQLIMQPTLIYAIAGNGSSRIRTCESPFKDFTGLANQRPKPLDHASTLSRTSLDTLSWQV